MGKTSWELVSGSSPLPGAFILAPVAPLVARRISAGAMQEGNEELDPRLHSPPVQRAAARVPRGSARSQGSSRWPRVSGFGVQQGQAGTKGWARWRGRALLLGAVLCRASPCRRGRVVIYTCTGMKPRAEPGASWVWGAGRGKRRVPLQQGPGGGCGIVGASTASIRALPLPPGTEN